MADQKDRGRFLDDYRGYYASVLKPTENELRAFLKNWKSAGYWVDDTKRTRLPAPSPIQRAYANIKRPESVVDKILRKPSDYPDGLTIASVRRMTDAVRARAIVYFLSGFPIIDKELRNSELVEISDDDPPIAYLNQDLWMRLSLGHMKRSDKSSGYTSVHYILRFRDSQVPRDDRPWFELQVRTLAEDAWAEIEHVLGYKPDKKTSLGVKKQFRILSSQIGTIDETFNVLYEELLRFQEEVVFKDDNPLNAENLPPVLMEIGVSCAQREIDGLLKLLASRGIQFVGALRAAASVKRMEMIKNTYRNQEGRSPGGFEIVASLAVLKDVDDDDEQGMIARIKEHIEYLKAWDELRRRS